MFHVTSNFMSSFSYDVDLDLPVHLDHFLLLSLCINYHVVDHLRAHFFSSFSSVDVKVVEACADGDVVCTQVASCG